jgi:signal transduction histidine kinase
MQRVSFVNRVSHELKTPLTNIRMYAELLDENLSEADTDARKQTEIIVSESRRLSRLIGNVLAFASQQKGRLTVRRSDAVPDDVIRSVVDMFEPTLESNGITVRFEPGASDRVGLDRDALGQILGNLLSNVNKYAASGKLVIVKSIQKNGMTEILVSDRGPGVPRDKAESIFAPFMRLSDRLIDGVTGTGIGLTIARELARLHGGDVVLVESDVGATFKVTLNTPSPGVQETTETS